MRIGLHHNVWHKVEEQAIEKARQEEEDCQKAHDATLDLAGLRAELNTLRGKVAEILILQAQLGEMANLKRHRPYDIFHLSMHLCVLCVPFDPLQIFLP